MTFLKQADYEIELGVNLPPNGWIFHPQPISSMAFPTQVNSSQARGIKGVSFSTEECQLAVPSAGAGEALTAAEEMVSAVEKSGKGVTAIGILMAVI